MASTRDIQFRQLTQICAPVVRGGRLAGFISFNLEFIAYTWPQDTLAWRRVRDKIHIS
jgi:hypothetical protein